VERVLQRDPLAASGERAPLRGLATEADKRSGKRIDVTGRDEEGVDPLQRKVRSGANSCAADDGEASDDRLPERDAKRLEGGGKDEELRSGVARRQLSGRQRTYELDGHQGCERPLPKRALQRAVADNGESRLVRAETRQREGVKKRVEALVRDEPGDGEDLNRTVSRRRACRRRSPKRLLVDRLEADGDGASVNAKIEDAPLRGAANGDEAINVPREQAVKESLGRRERLLDVVGDLAEHKERSPVKARPRKRTDGGGTELRHDDDMRIEAGERRLEALRPADRTAAAAGKLVGAKDDSVIGVLTGKPASILIPARLRGGLVDDTKANVIPFGEHGEQLLPVWDRDRWDDRAGGHREQSAAWAREDGRPTAAQVLKEGAAAAAWAPEDERQTAARRVRTERQTAAGC
jgi:hypothetical protein